MRKEKDLSKSELDWRKKTLIIILIFVGLVVTSGLIGYYLFFSPKGIEIDKSKYPITGIDISQHSGKVDFTALNYQGIDFIYIKATNGIDYIDPHFQEYYTSSVKTDYSGLSGITRLL